jgi:hypothetical protein
MEFVFVFVLLCDSCRVLGTVLSRAVPGTCIIRPS